MFFCLKIYKNNYYLQNSCIYLADKVCVLPNEAMLHVLTCEALLHTCSSV